MFLAGSLLLSWYGPVAPSDPPAYARVVIQGEAAGQPDETVCGELKAQDGRTTVLDVAGVPDPRRLPTPRLKSVVLVPGC